MKASIIYNPNAGSKDMQHQIRRAGEHLQSHGWSVRWCETTHAGHATELAREAAIRGDGCAIAAGGDGTLNEVMNGLVHQKTALGLLPAGTANVFAADMGIPTPGPGLLTGQSLTKAADLMLTGQTRCIDVAKSTFGNGTTRYFLLWAGVGLDAAVSRAVEADYIKQPGMKSLGMVSWMISAFFVLREFRGTRMRIKMDQKVINRRIIMASINNSSLYGRFWRLTPEAKLDDGLLDVAIMQGYGLKASLKHFTLIMLGQHAQDPDVKIFRTRRIQIRAKEPMPVHLDAENTGITPINIEIVPGALNILLPLHTAGHHFLHT